MKCESEQSFHVRSYVMGSTEEINEIDKKRSSMLTNRYVCISVFVQQLTCMQNEVQTKGNINGQSLFNGRLICITVLSIGSNVRIFVENVDSLGKCYFISFGMENEKELNPSRNVQYLHQIKWNVKCRNNAIIEIMRLCYTYIECVILCHKPGYVWYYYFRPK